MNKLVNGFNESNDSAQGCVWGGGGGALIIMGEEPW